MNAHHQDPGPKLDNIEAEQALLGALMVNNDALDAVSSFLKSEHFAEPLHRRIYDLIHELVRMDKVATPVTLKSFLPVNETIGGVTVMQYLARLAGEAVTVINARDYGRAIYEMWVRRQTVATCQDIINTAINLGPDQELNTLVDGLQDQLTSVQTAARIEDASNIHVADEWFGDMEEAARRGKVEGVPIGMRELSSVISEDCFEAGNLYGLLSSSGEGKTSLTCQIMFNAIQNDHPVLFLSYDQSGIQTVRQIFAQHKSIEARRQRGGLLSEDDMAKAINFREALKERPFAVRKCTDQKASQLVSIARGFVRAARNGKVPLIVVDHIQAVEPEDRKAHEGRIANSINQVFKAGAEQTKSAWLILNQRNTYGMRRENPRPIAGDIFGGQGALYGYDTLFYLYRFQKFYQEAMKLASDEKARERVKRHYPVAVTQDAEDLAELGALKVRFGDPNIRERVQFKANFTRYESIGDVPPEGFDF